ncbi:hypothetical protein [Azohydromonas lata]|uniref:hypothetical protein n=1 Tax=Azohydromonas lata TaxID=45677 RepID=UPI000A782EB3|nr:hypothetical protein [Azohydromonas lata]
MLLKKVSQALAAAGLLGAGLAGCGGGADAPSTSATEKAASVMVSTTGPLGATSTASLASAGVSDAPIMFNGTTATGGVITTTAPPLTLSQPIRVVDGPLRNALVCLDANGNGACDSGEVQGRSGADGRLTLQMSSTIVGKYPLLAVVGTDAVDGTTAVATRFVLMAPADQAAVVTPLTTLVQAWAELAGSTTAVAAAAVQSAAGLAVSPLKDYTGATDAASVRAATLARLLVLAQQQAASALKAGVVGQKDFNGVVATQADLDKALRYALVDALPSLGAVAAATAADTTLTAATREAALLAAAKAAIGADLKLDAGKVLTLIGASKLPLDAAAGTKLAGGNLRGFTFSDANNWFFRANLSTAADNTPGADGTVRYYSRFERNAAGKVSDWGFHGDSARAGDLHWNGTAWSACPLGTRSTQKPQTGTRWTYSYCAGMEQGASWHSSVDVSGKTLLEVVTRLRGFPGSADGVPYAQWGPSDLKLLGTTAKFPTGAKLQFSTGFATATAPAYDVQGSAIATAYTAAVAAGGDARNGAKVACGAVTPTNSATYKTTPAKLEDLVAVSRGTPCIYGTSTNADGTSLARNEWWSNSTVSLGKATGAMAQPAGTGNYYTTTALLRVAFGTTGNATTYYKCLERTSDGSTRNCTQIGKGTYAIATLGDARVMSFTDLPLLSQRQGWSRVLVQRGGKIYFGYQNRVGAISSQARLNLTAANAVFGQLKISPLTPQ